LKQAITLLVIACPCALVISTQLAIYAIYASAKEPGAKGGKYIEAMAVKAIALDKTRTNLWNSYRFRYFSAKRNREELACTAGIELSLNIHWRKPLLPSKAEGLNRIKPKV
jgi:Cd2+/Zn2+-exporting ATPase